MIGKSVEMISNSIKEMRTYGEGFLIIDQSPLAVDSSVVENTSTKIIMNTPSKEACEELGSALSLNPEQTKELSRLNVGIAAVMQKGWLSPVLMKIGRWNPHKYEASPVIENVNLIKLVRSRLVEELFRQCRVQKFSPAPLEEIIRNAELSADRRAELLEITELYRSLRKSPGMNVETLGRLFLEIINCESLFDIIPHDDIPSKNVFLEGYDKRDDAEQRYLYAEVIAAIRRWLSRVKRALNQYISVDREVKHHTLNYMLAFKGDSGRKSETAFALICSFCVNEELDNFLTERSS